MMTTKENPIKKNNTWLVFFLMLLTAGCNFEQSENIVQFRTICNPVNISYRFMPEAPSRREAADPSVIVFKSEYYLFASKSGGYWYSSDLADWNFVETDQIPVEDYAPTAIVLEDTVYFLASSREKSTVYKSADPKSGAWSIAKDSLDITGWDPAFFQDDDGRLYLFWGCANDEPIYGVEINHHNNFSLVGDIVSCIESHPEVYGWENRGDYNQMRDSDPWIEGAWMNKFKGKYYLQYSAPGTEYKSYADGVYVSDNPLGPFKYQAHNPFSSKPEGFASGAGHGSTFQDEFGNYWHIATSSLSVIHKFERRLGLYPVFFDEDGIMYANTKFGDYPVMIPEKKSENFNEIFPGWMLLSYNKNVRVSSMKELNSSGNITDEDIRTTWSAETGGDKEWVSMDLGMQCDVYAIQINFAERNTQIYGRQQELSYKYMLEYSDDEKKWEELADKSENTLDRSHDYIQLENPVKCRFVKLKNIKVSAGNFALSGLRVFGKGRGKKPHKTEFLDIRRKPDDKRVAQINWKHSQNVTGYNIAYGIHQDKLYHNHIVYGDTSLLINSLTSTDTYYFAVECFNENGISDRSEIIKIE